MNVEAAFITSAASSRDFPDDGLPEIGLVGRSNVGKSSLINALVRQRIARTSSAPGKTRLANIYRVRRGGSPPLYLVDLPGYGFARGGSTGFEALVAAYFGRPLRDTPQQRDGSGDEPPEGSDPIGRAALLLVDARHPGLERDRAAWTWILERSGAAAVVATKIDKLSRAERQRASRELDAVFELPVLPVSAVTGEGLDELWILIDRLANNSSRRRPPRSPHPPRATAPPPRPKRSSASTSRR